MSTSRDVSFALESEVSGETLILRLNGRLDAYSTGPAWRQARELLERLRPRSLQLDAARLNYVDGTGVAFFAFLRQNMTDAHGPAAFSLRNLAPRFADLVELYGTVRNETLETADFQLYDIADEVGRRTFALFEEKFRHRLIFLGEFISHAFRAFFRPRYFRWGEMFQVAERAGVDSLPIILLIGFLLGLIMAFQSAIPMRMYGAEIFVANLIGLSLLRELGPLITAVILAGRTGSSFAAELGTMKINEEIDAMSTMGVEPMRFLVLPRVGATLLVIPLLTVFFDVAGLLGGMVVLMSLGYPPIVFFDQVVSAVDMIDLAGGLFKSGVFGMLIAGIGCYMGLTTKSGAGAVGISTTRAVVSGIIFIAMTDGFFAVLFFLLDI